MKTTLRDFAEYVRSKNAGPFWMTFEIFLKNKEDYDKLIGMNVVTPELISRLYGTPADQVQMFFCDNISIIKISIPRPVSQGSPEDKDMHAGQQSVFLGNIELECPE